jgi:glycosyltransferase involved in cell wall biosynthesis
MMDNPCKGEGCMADARGRAQNVKHWPGCSCEAPEISVLIPCWHGELTLAGSLDSVEAQSGLPPELGVEIVVVADGRQEDGRIVEEWIQQRGETRAFALTLVQLADNVGAGAARRIGYAFCRGRFLAFLDDDDVWHPRKLSVQWQWHQDNLERIASAHGYDEQTAGRDRSFVRLLVGGCSLPTPTVMIRRSLWPYEPEPYRYGEDWLTLAMIARHQPIMVLPSNLAWRSKLAPPIASDPYSLSRHRLKLRAGKLRALWILVRRGCLNPIWMPVLAVWSLVLAFRRCLLDWADGFRQPVA